LRESGRKEVSPFLVSANCRMNITPFPGIFVTSGKTCLDRRRNRRYGPFPLPTTRLVNEVMPMVRRCLPLGLLAAILATGCVNQFKEFIGDTQPTNLVPPSTVGTDNPAAATRPRDRSAYPPASGEIGWRVEMVGRKVLTANPQTGLRPVFITIGSPEPEVFHGGVNAVYVTQGLVQKCQTDGQLAAVLSLELGKMVSEREALASPGSRRPERRPPPEVPFGNAGQGAGAFDQVREAELARFGPVRRRPAEVLPPPDPKLLAREYLKKTGYLEAELDGVTPLLDAARGNYNLEKQLKATTPAWSPTR
jgi:hypothetical protein